ncbi:MAG: hypothetical protein NVS4B2_27200 [Chloroflexota bacterium]
MATPSKSTGSPVTRTRYVGHPHFWERAVSRGSFLKAAASVSGAVIGSEVWMPGLARARPSRSVLPRPIPGGFLGPGNELFHVFVPAPGNELSTITDFKGFIAAARTCRATERHDAHGTTTLYVDTDTRFMQGQYIGVDGRRHHGTFGFF